MIGAYAYLTLRSTRNRYLMRFRQLRRPRYVAALLIGLAYFWFLFFRPAWMGGSPPPASRGADVAMQTLATFGIFAAVVATWVFSTSRQALAFSPAEVQFLFPAPVTRRQLLVYKLVRVQFVLLINALLWVFILRRSGADLPNALRVLSAWLVIAGLYLHRVASALVRTSWAEHGAVSIRRHPVTLAVLLGAAGVVLNALWRAVPAARAAGPEPKAMIGPVVEALTSGAAGLVLTPIRWLLAPTFAPDPVAWALAMPGAIAVVAALALWVFRSDVAFEETAIVASAERAKLIEQYRRRQGGAHAPPKTPRRTLPLSPRGAPAVAIAWKNVLAAARSVSGTFLGTMTILLGFMVVAIGHGERFGTPRLVTAGAIMGIAMLMFFGPRLIRNDMRQDMAYLSLLKTYPLRGRTIVLTEVATTALVLVGGQTLLLLAGIGGAVLDPAIPVGALEILLVLLLVPPALFALQMVLTTVYNGVAILFPGWVTHDPAATSGPEVLGQAILTSVASLLAVVLALVPPSAGAAGTFGLLKHWGLSIPLAGAGGIAMAIAVLAMELALAFEWLGGALERMEATPRG